MNSIVSWQSLSSCFYPAPILSLGREPVVQGKVTSILVIQSDQIFTSLQRRLLTQSSLVQCIVGCRESILQTLHVGILNGRTVEERDCAITKT